MENNDNSILLQFAKFSRGFRISDFDEFVEEYIGLENLDFFGRLAYPNQWQMRLTKPDIRERLIRMGKTRIKSRCCWMYPLNQQEIRGFVHWLPNLVTNDQLREHLKLYGTVLFLESQERTIKGRNVESDPRYYGLMLPHGTVKEMLPHFLKINNFLCLMVVRGREPACFHCKEVGHLRAHCLKYKEKLNSYCSRDPNTAPLRLKPRGKRHLQIEAEVTSKTNVDDISSSNDEVLSERAITVDEETAEPVSNLECHENVSETEEEDISGSFKELAKTGVLARSGTKSGIPTSTTSISATETLSGFVETLQQVKRRTQEDLQLSLANFEKEFSEKLFPFTKEQTRGEEQVKPSLEFRAKEEISTSIEISRKDSNVDHGTKKGKIQSRPLNVHQEKDLTETFEKICEETKKLDRDIELYKSLGSTGESSIKESCLQFYKETLQQTAKEMLDRTYENLEESVKNKIGASEKFSKDSATNKGQRLTEDNPEIQSEQAIQKVSECVKDNFKKIEEEIDRLSIQLTNKQAHTDAKLTNDQMYFSFEMLKQTKETVEVIVCDTLLKLQVNLKKSKMLD